MRITNNDTFAFNVNTTLRIHHNFKDTDGSGVSTTL